ncbi:Maltose O-acetyltransferase [compost metagenome]
MIGVLKKGIWSLLGLMPFTRFFFETRDTQTPIRFGMWFIQKIVGYNKDAYWPMHFTSIVSGAKNIYAGIDTSPGYSPGCYIQGGGKVYIGDYTQIAPNVGIISANHDLHDSRKKIQKTVVIGKYCWIGMNAVILPGVILGDFTIVAAGAIVSKSFEEGYCVIGGNPAKKIKDLEREKCNPFVNEYEYNGYLSANKFQAFREKHLNV